MNPQSNVDKLAGTILWGIRFAALWWLVIVPLSVVVYWISPAAMFPFLLVCICAGMIGMVGMALYRLARLLFVRRN